MAMHELEKRYGLTAEEILDAIAGRFRLRTAIEGAVAEVHMERAIKPLVGKDVDRFEAHDLDGQPDFSLWLPQRAKALRAECKTVRNSDEAYRQGGEIVAYKVETQKTRASQGDPTSRFYDVDQFEIVGVCLGKKTGNWSQFLFICTADLQRHSKYPQKLAVMQRVPLPNSTNMRPWYDDLGQLIREKFQ